MQRYVQLVEGRVSALLSFQRLLARQGWAATSLHSLVEASLGALRSRANWDGPELAIVHTAAQPIGMALHELATNSVGHGALSVPEGRVALRWFTEDDTLRLVWTESGGPKATSPARRGFGMRLVDSSIRTQLRGNVAWHWKTEGLVCEFFVPLVQAIGAAAVHGMATDADTN
jgi:two-component sensor histidine kinase